MLVSAAFLLAGPLKNAEAKFAAPSVVSGTSIAQTDAFEYSIQTTAGTAIQPGTATPTTTGANQTLTIDLGRVPDSRTITDVVRLRNIAASAQTVDLAVFVGLPSIIGLEYSDGTTSKSLAPGATYQLRVRTNAAFAGSQADNVRFTNTLMANFLLLARPLTTRQAPLAPTSPTAVRGAPPGPEIDLGWTASASTGISGYNVYRATASSGPFTKINGASVAGTTYGDSSVTAGQTYWYRVRAIAAGVSPELESVDSSTISARYAPAPTAVRVPVGGSNPANYVNNATQATVTGQVDVPASSIVGDVVNVRYTSGATSVTRTFTLVAAGAQTVNVTGANLTALADGPVTLNAWITDGGASGNSVAGSATKDTLAPSAPSGSRIAATASNPVNYINIATGVAPGTATAGIDVPVTSMPTDTVSVRLTMGASTVTGTGAGLFGTGTVSIAGLSTDGWAQGALTVEARVQDAAGNYSGWVAGTAATRDTVASNSPTGSRIAATASNPVNYINIATGVSPGTATAGIDVPASSMATDTVSVRLTSGANTFTGTGSGLAGAGTVSIAGLNTNGWAQGSVTVAARVQDLAGNDSGWVTGTAATRDTFAPSAPTGSRIAATASNPVNFINIATGVAPGTATAGIDVPATSMPTDTVSVRLTMGASTVTGTAAGLVGAGTVSIAGLSTDLWAQGAVAVAARVQDAAGNDSGWVAGTAATRDTLAPSAPTASRIAATASNPVNYINIATGVAPGTATAGIDVPAGSLPTDTVSVRLTSGANTVTGTGGGLGGAGTVSIAGLSTDLWAQGAVAVAARVQDAAGNDSGWVTGTAATRDTVAAVSGSYIAATASNSVNYINIATGVSPGTATAGIDVPASGLATDTVSVRLTSGANTFTGTGSGLAGAGTVSIAGLSTNGWAQGAVTVAARVQDVAGNDSGWINGTAATRDTLAPSAPTGSRVAATASNPVNYINIVTGVAPGTATAGIDVPAGSLATDTVSVRLTSGANTVTGTGGGLGGAGTVSIAGLSTDGWAQGAVTVAARVQDLAGNDSGWITGTAATRDTVAPSAPTGSRVAATASNPVNYINIATGVAPGTATAGIDVPAGSLATDTVSVRLTSGANTVTGTGTGGGLGGAGTVSIAGLSTDLWAQGAVAVAARVQDAAGNDSGWVTGTAATRDTVAAVSGSYIAATASNPVNYINIATGVAPGTATAGIDVPASSLATDTVSARLTLGASTVTGTGAGLAGAGTVSIAGLNTNGWANGTVTVQARVQDVAGNDSGWITGTAATRDTVAATPPTAAQILATVNNPANTINIATQYAAGVTVTTSAGAVSVDARLTVAGVPAYGSATGSGTVLVPVDASTLADAAAGGVQVAARQYDLAGNSSAWFVGTAALKDTIVPFAPDFTRIAFKNVSPGNDSVRGSAGALDSNDQVRIHDYADGADYPNRGYDASNNSGMFGRDNIAASVVPRTIGYDVRDSAWNPIDRICRYYTANGIGVPIACP